MVFIDLRNILGSAEHHMLSYKIDQYFLTTVLANSRRIVGAYVFDAKIPNDVSGTSERLHEKLKMQGFRVMARDSYDKSRNEQKEVDVAMACEMVVHALRDNYDVAIVVSGDRDFIPAIQQIQAAGKMVEVAAFRNAVGKEMKVAADRFYDLDEIPLMRMEGCASADGGPDPYPEGAA
jgi:uncharacterized LabA/DUF88 family protein